MESGIYANNFAEALTKLLRKSSVSCYHIAQYSHLDQAYLSRLKSGQRRNPTPETVMRISLGLVRCSDKLTIDDVESLFNSVGRSLHISS